MKKKKLVLRKPVIITFIVIFLILGISANYKLLKWNMDTKKTDDLINKINENNNIMEVTDNENTIKVNPPNEKINKDNPYWDYMKMNLIDANFTDIKKKNNDVVGWIQVSGTNINYPFVQTTDNTYYLTKDINKNNNSAGWVFMDYRNNIKDFDKNTILYAHSRVNGTMFGSLKNIMNNDWYNNKLNHVIKLSTEYENTLWQVFSVYITPVVNDYIQIEFNNSDRYLEFLNMIQKRSAYTFDVSLNNLDKILTLSTCYNDNERVVMHAKLIKMEVKNGHNWYFKK